MQSSPTDDASRDGIMDGGAPASEPLLRTSPRKLVPFASHPSATASLSSPDASIQHSDATQTERHRASFATHTRVRTRTRRLLYDQRRCISCLQPLVVIIVASAVLAAGVLLLIQTRTAGMLGMTSSAASVAAYVLLAFGLILPPLALLACLWAGTPSRSRAQYDACLADALLEELLSGTSVNEHYDVYGAEQAANGTVVILSAAAAPRIVSNGFAERVGVQYKTLTVDLPGHGSLVNVLFSLPRCERVLSRIIEREVASNSNGRAAGAASAPPSRRGTMPRPSGDAGLSSSDEDARAPLGASMSGIAVYGSAYPGAARSGSSMPNGAVGATAAMAARFGALRSSYGMALGALTSPGAAAPPRRADSDAGMYSPPSFPATPMSDRLLSPSFSTASPAVAVGFVSPASATPVGGKTDVTEDTSATAATGSAARSSSVILVAYGASAYVAAHYAVRYPHRVAGVILLGPVPQYAVPGSCTRMSESMYRLRWVAALANAGLKSRIQTHPKASEEDKAALLSQDWHFGVLPEFMACVRGQVLIPQLRSVERPILVLGPLHWTAQARLQLPVAHAHIATVRGLKNESLPTLNPSKLDELAAGLMSFARDAYTAAEAAQRVRVTDSFSAAAMHRGSSVAGASGRETSPIPVLRGAGSGGPALSVMQAGSYASVRHGSGTGSSSISERGGRVTISDSGAGGGDGFYWPKRGGTFASTGSGMPAHSLSTSVHAGFMGHGRRGGSALATQVMMAPEQQGAAVVGNTDSE